MSRVIKFFVGLAALGAAAFGGLYGWYLYDTAPQPPSPPSCNARRTLDVIQDIANKNPASFPKYLAISKTEGWKMSAFYVKFRMPETGALVCKATASAGDKKIYLNYTVERSIDDYLRVSISESENE